MRPTKVSRDTDRKGLAGEVRSGSMMRAGVESGLRCAFASQTVTWITEDC